MKRWKDTYRTKTAAQFIKHINSHPCQSNLIATCNLWDMTVFLSTIHASYFTYKSKTTMLKAHWKLPREPLTQKLILFHVKDYKLNSSFMQKIWLRNVSWTWININQIPPRDKTTKLNVMNASSATLTVFALSNICVSFHQCSFQSLPFL